MIALARMCCVPVIITNAALLYAALLYAVMWRAMCYLDAWMACTPYIRPSPLTSACLTRLAVAASSPIHLLRVVLYFAFLYPQPLLLFHLLVLLLLLLQAVHPRPSPPGPLNRWQATLPACSVSCAGCLQCKLCGLCSGGVTLLSLCLVDILNEMHLPLRCLTGSLAKVIFIVSTESGLRLQSNSRNPT